MNINRLYKLSALIAFILILVVFFVLFGKIQNLFLSNNIAGSPNSIYFLLTLAGVLIVIIFIISVISSSRQDDLNKYAQKSSITFENSTQKNFEGDQDEEIFDLENYTKKILPKENSNLDLIKYSEKILSNIAKEFDIVQGLLFVKEKNKDIFNIIGKYAYFGEEEPRSFKLGETMSGQVAKNKTVLNLEEVPENYITILSGLGSSSPNHLIIIPVIVDSKTIAIIELASFKKFKQNFIDLFMQMSEQIGNALLKF